MFSQLFRGSASLLNFLFGYIQRFFTGSRLVSFRSPPSESFLGLELGHLRMFSLLGAPALKLAGPPRVSPDYDLGFPQILLGSS